MSGFTNFNASNLLKKSEDGEIDTENIRYSKDKMGFKVVEKKSKETCCICNEYIWYRDSIVSSHMEEAFRVIDQRAYNEPIDFPKVTDNLLTCHWACEETLNERLRSSTFEKK
jgi:hypothetical protein